MRKITLIIFVIGFCLIECLGQSIKCNQDGDYFKVTTSDGNDCGSYGSVSAINDVVYVNNPTNPNNQNKEFVKAKTVDNPKSTVVGLDSEGNVHVNRYLTEYALQSDNMQFTFTFFATAIFMSFTPATGTTSTYHFNYGNCLQNIHPTGQAYLKPGSFHTYYGHEFHRVYFFFLIKHIHLILVHLQRFMI